MKRIGSVGSAMGLLRVTTSSSKASTKAAKAAKAASAKTAAKAAAVATKNKTVTVVVEEIEPPSKDASEEPTEPQERKPGQTIELPAIDSSDLSLGLADLQTVDVQSVDLAPKSELVKPTETFGSGTSNSKVDSTLLPQDSGSIPETRETSLPTTNYPLERFPTNQYEGSSSNSLNSNSTPATSLTAATSDVSVPKDRLAKVTQSSVDDDGHSAFTALQHNLAKFTSRQPGAKANVLRLTLLPFLRQQRHIVLPSANSLALRTSVLEAWWSQILVDLVHAAPSDRALYYEAISSIMARPEWLATTSDFTRVLSLTVVHALDKCTQPTLSGPMQAFVGKTLAYAFFYLPNFGAYVLSRLNSPRDIVHRLTTQLDLHVESPISTQLAVQALPRVVHSLVGLRQVLSRDEHPRIASLLPNDPMEAWTRYWHADSEMFMSFLKHYFAVLSRLLPPPPPPEKLTAADGDFLRIGIVSPGLVVILASIAAPLEHLVATNRQSLFSRRPPVPFPPNASPQRDSLSPPPPNRLQDQPQRQTRAPAQNPVRIDQLKILKCLREILHNDEACVPYYHHFALQFDRMLQTVAVRIRVSNMEACASLCDLVEEWFSSLTLSHHPLSSEQVRSTKHLAVDWDFWVLVAQRMLSGDNCHAEVRALAFLFNIWSLLPIDQLMATTRWVLDEKMWEQYFCHWSPLIRSYYHRLLCYRVINPTQRSADMVEAAFLTHTRQILSHRLASVRYQWVQLSNSNHSTPGTAPSLPLPRCCVAITANPAALAPPNDTLRAYPYDIFDNAAYWSSMPWPGAKDNSRNIVLSHKSSNNSFSSSVLSSPGSYAASAAPSLRSQASSSSLRSTTSTMSTMSTISVFSSPKKWWKIFRSDKKDLEPVKPKEPKKHHHRRNHSELSVAHLPPPMQLVAPRPEIERPRHRFVLVPTRFQPNDRAPLSVPRLPHSRPVEVVENPTKIDSDRAVWNYGARSLAEWNVTVAIYEEFLKTMWPEEMPFLVAEIPWRVAVW